MSQSSPIEKHESWNEKTACGIFHGAYHYLFYNGEAVTVYQTSLVRNVALGLFKDVISSSYTFTNGDAPGLPPRLSYEHALYISQIRVRLYAKDDFFTGMMSETYTHKETCRRTIIPVLDRLEEKELAAKLRSEWRIGAIS